MDHTVSLGKLPDSNGLQNTHQL